LELSTCDKLSFYEDIKSLNGNEHITLVKNITDGNMYVKKRLKCYDLSIYKVLSEKPVDNMPKICSLFLDNGDLIVIEEYIEGITIEEYLTKKGLFSETKAVEIAKQICETLIKLHKHKPAIIHRDIKPANIIITPNDKIFLIDLNAAKFEKKYENKDTVLIGTVGHAAPEQYGFGSSTPQTDIYGLGVLLNIMLTGYLPSDKLYGKGLKRTIKRCIELNPKDRFTTAEKLYKELKLYNSAYIRWLPPGFRSLNIFKMLIACFGYYQIIDLSYEFSLDFDTPETVYLYRIVLLVALLLIVMFYCNYMGIRKIFPFMNSENAFIRFLVMLIAPLMIFGVILVIGALFQVLVLE